MSDTAHIDIEKLDHLVDPPIIDFLAHDPQLKAYVAEFVPEEQVSPELKESVVVPDNTPTSRRIAELLEALRVELAVDANIARLAHAGGGGFDCYFDDGRALSPGGVAFCRSDDGGVCDSSGPLAGSATGAHYAGPRRQTRRGMRGNVAIRAVSSVG